MYATKIPWVTKIVGPRYGTDDTYKLAAEWLAPCQTVADWGGGRGYFKQFLHLDADYILVEGTEQEHPPDTAVVIADLAAYHGQSEGILMRHVLDMSDDWPLLLRNALDSFTKRMVLITFTPHVKRTRVKQHHLTWPVYAFDHVNDLIPRMQPYLHHTEHLVTVWSPLKKHSPLPETIYYLEKP